MSTGQISVILTHTVKPETRHSFLQEIEKKVSIIRQHEGCIQLTVYEDTDDPNKIIAFQTWKSQAHWLTHLQSNIGLELTALANSTTTKFSLEKLILQNI